MPETGQTGWTGFFTVWSLAVSLIVWVPHFCSFLVSNWIICNLKKQKYWSSFEWFQWKIAGWTRRNTLAPVKGENWIRYWRECYAWPTVRYAYVTHGNWFGSQLPLSVLHTSSGMCFPLFLHLFKEKINSIFFCYRIRWNLIFEKIRWNELQIRSNKQINGNRWVE